jgi:hypothetical protein
MLPSDVLVTPTVAGVPELVFGGCADADEEEPPLLPQAASVSPASATIAPLARKVRADLRGIMIRSFDWGIAEHRRSGPSRTELFRAPAYVNDAPDRSRFASVNRLCGVTPKRLVVNARGAAISRISSAAPVTGSGSAWG